MNQVRRAIGFLNILFAVSIAMGCTRGPRQIEIRTPDGKSARLPASETLRTNIVTEPSTLDWTISADATSAEVEMNVMEGLVQYNLDDKELALIPGLALKWEALDHAQKWKFRIRENVKWSDGVAFTPQHVLDGWKRLLDRETASPYSYFLYGIKNARPFHDGKVGFDQVGARITGPNEISVELERPMSFFPYLLTHHSTWPVRFDVIKKHGNLWTDPGKIVTLGAYRLKGWEHDYLMVLEKNDAYYGEKAVTPYIAMYMIGEQATAINLYEAGKLDTVDKVTSIERRKLRGRADFVEMPSLNLYYYGFNTTKPPMDRPLVRAALAHAIDRTEIVKLLDGTYTPVSGWVPPGMFGFNKNAGIKFDPDEARLLLKKAGYKSPAEFPRIQIAFNTNEDHQRIAENIQEQLKRNLGISVELKNLEWKVFLATTKTDPPEIFRYGWVADYPDPDNYFSLMLSFSENNHARWKNLVYDDLVIKASAELEHSKRKILYDQAEKILTEIDVPVLPLMARVEGTLVAPKIQNFPLNSMAYRVYKKVRLK